MMHQSSKSQVRPQGARVRASSESTAPPPRVTMAQRFKRGVIGFALSWVWCSVGSLLWLAALAVGYGGLDEGLSRLKDESWAPVAMAAYFGAVTGCWVGGTVGPVTIGPCRRHRPVLYSSLLGGVMGGALATAAGAAVGWVWQDEARSDLGVEPAMYVGVGVGIIAGRRAGRVISSAETVCGSSTTRTSGTRTYPAGRRSG